jgi:hypothetical protein
MSSPNRPELSAGGVSDNNFKSAPIVFLSSVRLPLKTIVPLESSRGFSGHDPAQNPPSASWLALKKTNRREPDFRTTNGELVAVSRIDEQKRIHLQDGRTLPENHKQFTHGYAISAHCSQGKSVDAVVSADGMRKDLFYVAASRAGRASPL